MGKGSEKVRTNAKKNKLRQERPACHGAVFQHSYAGAKRVTF